MLASVCRIYFTTETSPCNFVNYILEVKEILLEHMKLGTNYSAAVIRWFKIQCFGVTFSTLEPNIEDVFFSI